MVNRFKIPFSRIEKFINHAASLFSVQSVSKGVYKDVHKGCSDAVLHLDNVLSMLADLKQQHKADVNMQEHIVSMIFFADKMRSELKSRVPEAMITQNSVLGLASLQLLKKSWFEVQEGYSGLLEKTGKSE
ncbi:MAG: hypothetical protein AABX52_03035 [Nanoarchaeota archaeon]